STDFLGPFCESYATTHGKHSMIKALTGRRASVFPEPASENLVIQLQSKLDLPRIIRSIARRSDFAKVCAGEVRRIRNGDYTVTAKSWRIEVRVIQDVEHLSAELQAEALLHLEFFECREVQSAETWSDDLSGTRSQSSCA